MNLPPDTLRLAQAGDPGAQTAFLREVDAPLRSLLRRMGASAEREDTLQALYLKLLDVLPRFRPEGPASLGTWVYTVAHRFLLEQRRRPRLVTEALDSGLDVADPSPSAERTASDRELWAQVERALGQLSEAHRRVFVLAHLHHQPLEDIAAVEGVPLGTVKSRLHRARAELVLLLGPALDDWKGARNAASR